jgi:CheY-like chemotaxis protein
MTLLQALQAALLNPIPAPTAILQGNGPDTISRGQASVFANTVAPSAISATAPVELPPPAEPIGVSSPAVRAHLHPPLGSPADAHDNLLLPPAEPRAQHTISPPALASALPGGLPATLTSPGAPVLEPRAVTMSAPALQQAASIPAAKANVVSDAAIAPAVTPAPTAFSMTSPEAEFKPTRGAHILIVDDSALASQSLLSRLARFGLQADMASSGVQALSQTEAGQYSLVFLDVNMPNMDGYTVCRTLKRRKGAGGREMHVVMLTSRDGTVDKIRGKMVGCDGYLTKPLTDDALQSTLKRFGLLGSPQPQPPASLQWANKSAAL